MSDEWVSAEFTGGSSYLQPILAGFAGRAARSYRDPGDEDLYGLLREMISFRSDELMTLKDSTDLYYWKKLNELIRLVHSRVGRDPAG